MSTTDWERTIEAKDRTLDYLCDAVEDIYESLKEVEHHVYDDFPHIHPILPETITLSKRKICYEYPNLTPKERELNSPPVWSRFYYGIDNKLERERHDTALPTTTIEYGNRPGLAMVLTAIFWFGTPS